MDLGGATPLAVVRAGDGLETAIALGDWRIEVDPASAVPVLHERLTAGQAFIAGTDTGIVGYMSGDRSRFMAIAVSSLGTANMAASTAHRGAFTRWRIVAGAVERPAVIVDSEALVPAGQ